MAEPNTPEILSAEDFWIDQERKDDKGRPLVYADRPMDDPGGILGIGGTKYKLKHVQNITYTNGQVWQRDDDGKAQYIRTDAQIAAQYRSEQKAAEPKGPKTTIDEAKGKTYVTDPETGKTRVEPIEGWTPEPAPKGKSSYVTRGKKTYRIGDDDSIAEVPELALPDEPDRVGASTLYQQQQMNERDEKQRALQKYIADQTAAIRRGEIDAQTASKHVDQWLEAIQWAAPTKSGYLPGYEPGGSRSRAAKASGYDFDPEQYRATTYDPFRLAAAQGTPFGTQPVGTAPAGPIDPFQGAQMVDFEEMNRRVAALGAP